MHSLCAVIWYFTGKALAQCHTALLAHVRPTMFYIPLVIILVESDDYKVHLNAI